MKRSTHRQIQLLADLRLLEAQRGLERARTEQDQAEMGLQECIEDLAREREERVRATTRGVTVIELRLQELRDEEMRSIVEARRRALAACVRAVASAETRWREAETERRRAEKIGERIASEHRARVEKLERETLDEAGARRAHGRGGG